MSGRAKFKSAKKQIRSRIKESAHGQAAIDAASKDDFVTIARHGLLRRKSIRVAVPVVTEKTIYEKAKEQLDHIEVKTAEELERERRLQEIEEERVRRKLAAEEMERQRIKREEAERLRKLEEERLRQIEEEEERKRKEEEERERLAREAQERREALERQRQEAEEKARQERRADYQRKLDAVLNAANQQDREKALKEVGKLTMLDFNNQEEWEIHQREVGKLNILEIAGNFKKKGKKRKDRRKTMSINWSNAKGIISKFSDIQLQDEVIRFVKPTAVDLSQLEVNEPPMSPFDRSEDSVTPDSGLGGMTSQSSQDD